MRRLLLTASLLVACGSPAQEQGAPLATSEPEPVPEPQPEPALQPQPEPQAQPEPSTAEPVPEPQPQPEPSTVEPVPEPQPQPQPIPRPEPVSPLPITETRNWGTSGWPIDTDVEEVLDGGVLRGAITLLPLYHDTRWALSHLRFAGSPEYSAFAGLGFRACGCVFDEGALRFELLDGSGSIEAGALGVLLELALEWREYFVFWDELDEELVPSQIDGVWFRLADGAQGSGYDLAFHGLEFVGSGVTSLSSAEPGPCPIVSAPDQ